MAVVETTSGKVEGRETRLFRLMSTLQRLHADESFHAILHKHRLGDLPSLQGNYGS